MNTPQNKSKICNVALTVFSIVAVVSAVLDDHGQRLPAVHSTELIVRNVSLFVRVFISLMSLWAANLLDSRRF